MSMLAIITYLIIGVVFIVGSVVFDYYTYFKEEDFTFKDYIETNSDDVTFFTVSGLIWPVMLTFMAVTAIICVLAVVVRRILCKVKKDERMFYDEY